jgi:hypothetical protein
MNLKSVEYLLALRVTHDGMIHAIHDYFFVLPGRR